MRDNPASVQPLLELYASTLGYLIEGTKDVPEARMTEQFPGIVNHPAWMLSHLCTAAGGICQLLGDTSRAADPDEWTRFGPGTTPLADPTQYASKKILIEKLMGRHENAVIVVSSSFGAHAHQPPPPPFDQFAPTIGQIVTYLLAAHESYHLGQLMIWRRAAGLPRI